MIVFNLSCSHEHQFDGWFRSADDFDRQLVNGLVECPICNDHAITKQLSAPRINTGASEIRIPADKTAAKQEVMAATTMPGLQEHMLQQFKAFVRAHTENVGSEFAETARKIHYGEVAHRNIRGLVSVDDAIALHEEGIDTISLPPGIMLDEGVQ